MGKAGKGGGANAGTPFSTPSGRPIAPKPSGSRGPFIPPTDGSTTRDPESIPQGGPVTKADPKGPGSSGGDAVGNSAGNPFKGLK